MDENCTRLCSSTLSISVQNNNLEESMYCSRKHNKHNFLEKKCYKIWFHLNKGCFKFGQRDLDCPGGSKISARRYSWGFSTTWIIIWGGFAYVLISAESRGRGSSSGSRVDRFLLIFMIWMLISFFKQSQLGEIICLLIKAFCGCWCWTLEMSDIESVSQTLRWTEYGYLR